MLLFAASSSHSCIIRLAAMTAFIELNKVQHGCISHKGLETVECGICLDTILPCETFYESECHPLRHMTHLDCYNDYCRTRRESSRCPICRQVTIGEMEWHAMASVFGFDSVALWDVNQLPREAYRFARSYQRGEITRHQLWAMADAVRQ